MNKVQGESLERVLRFAEIMDRFIDDLVIVSTNTGAQTSVRTVIGITGPVATPQDFSVVRTFLEAQSPGRASAEPRAGAGREGAGDDL